MQHNEYNGYWNYETWVTALWLDNDQSTYNHIREMSKRIVTQAPNDPNVISDIWTIEQCTKYRLSDNIKEMVEEQAPELPASLYSDILNAGLSEINYSEIAGNILEE